eukprot:15438685-Alexandrium_andersonii.AAC.1
MRVECRAKGMQMLLSPADQSTGRPTAGVGILVRGGRPIARCVPHSQAFARYEAIGRVAHYLIAAGGRHALNFIVLYGWTNGSGSVDARSLSEGLAQAIDEEVKAVHGQAVVVCGDVNAELRDIGPLSCLVDSAVLCDLGGEAH